jgi:hypothetical protein
MEQAYFEGGEDCQIQPGCIIGLKYREGCRAVRLGNMARIRSGTIIYADVEIGEVARQWGAEVPFLRPRELGGDYAPLDEVITHALGVLEAHFRDAQPDRLDGLRLDWSDRWLLVRASNTEPIVRAVAEAATAEEARRLCEEAARVLGS